MAKYVITSGPCGGKSTLRKALHEQGYPQMFESSRTIIRHQQGKPDPVLPWTDLYRFQEYMVAFQIRKENRIKAETIFLDRGINDGLAYCWEGGISPPSELVHHSKQRRYDLVFVLDPVPYANDKERRENPERAELLHQLIPQSYTQYGYETIKVPVIPDDPLARMRAQYVIDQIKQRGFHDHKNKAQV